MGGIARVKGTVWAGAMAVLILAPISSHAVSLGNIAGTVSDVLGRPVADVLVTDGQTQTVETDAMGRYTLEHTLPGVFVIRISSVKIVPQSRGVTPLDTLSSVDFTALYTLGAYVAPSDLTSLPGELGITVRTHAPASPGCLAFKDESSGAHIDLVYQPPVGSDGRSVWTGGYTVPAGTADGSYRWSVVQTDCGNTVLTNSHVGLYHVSQS